ncbi:hypothetical protein [Enterococcus rivorum]|uniref:Uncharacterized protein n=1 Tax=Enterococcus rivorum TaxID=762845 RepID=A0A1E5KVH9_9ENTE|nr:hypothetical protein [Enterococcus rivorum]MBP2098310.1 putative nucleic acid-binding Zn-ribbon protein [Enterococcus rivorum]OEH81897.1 hypothetical protein BCR26_03855 [Enterococcus rivorum]
MKNRIFLLKKEDNHFFQQQDKTIKKQLQIIKKLQKRVHEEQRRKNQLASQLKRSLNYIEKLKKSNRTLKEEMNK